MTWTQRQRAEGRYTRYHRGISTCDGVPGCPGAKRACVCGVTGHKFIRSSSFIRMNRGRREGAPVLQSGLGMADLLREGFMGLALTTGRVGSEVDHHWTPADRSGFPHGHPPIRDEDRGGWEIK